MRTIDFEHSYLYDRKNQVYALMTYVDAGSSDNFHFRFYNWEQNISYDVDAAVETDEETGNRYIEYALCSMRKWDEEEDFLVSKEIMEDCIINVYYTIREEEPEPDDGNGDIISE